MNDVNLNRPDLKLVSSSDHAPARAPTSPPIEGSDVSAQSVTSASSTPDVADAVRPKGEPQAREGERVQLDDAVSRLNDFIQNVQRDLQFEIDHELGETIVRVVDQQTQEVIRQMPDEVALRLAENLQQDEPLTLFNLKV
ncbi:flagellar protein FlaG [Marinobacter sp. SS21]|uniref:flagellar protein FlaG n=1 Tax=Marinobacter sp. SS21 TaxID=2979460 RepID=UPI002330CAF1|nr:flagellar protein FlaG [Marinobacter sp. SS21]MDC0663836.1 flagellar protein FlaG [Marinobacter sp. SS21]